MRLPSHSTRLEDKPTLRRLVRERIAALSVDERARASLQVCQTALKLPAFQEAETVAVFSSLPSEPNLWPVMEVAWIERKRVVLPKIGALIRPAGEPPLLHWFPIRSLADLEPTLLPNGRTLMEPKASLPEVPCTEIDCLFVPGLAFDRAGWRLGRGGGYYDYVLAQLATNSRPIPHPGVMFACQQVDHLPTEPHDQRLSCVLTENGLQLFPGI